MGYLEPLLVLRHKQLGSTRQPLHTAARFLIPPAERPAPADAGWGGLSGCPKPRTSRNRGILYIDEHSTLKNYAQAAVWFRKAADQNFAAAESNFADLYFVGHGVPNDHTQFLIWLHRAADDGDPESQITLANMNFVGVGGVGRNNAEGVSLLRKAADQGYAPGQVLLARTYQLGQRTPKDPKQAALWYRKAGVLPTPAEAEGTIRQHSKAKAAAKSSRETG